MQQYIHKMINCNQKKSQHGGKSTTQTIHHISSNEANLGCLITACTFMYSLSNLKYKSGLQLKEKHTKKKHLFPEIYIIVQLLRILLKYSQHKCSDLHYIELLIKSSTTNSSKCACSFYQKYHLIQAMAGWQKKQMHHNIAKSTITLF